MNLITWWYFSCISSWYLQARYGCTAWYFELSECKIQPRWRALSLQLSATSQPANTESHISTSVFTTRRHRTSRTACGSSALQTTDKNRTGRRCPRTSRNLSELPSQALSALSLNILINWRVVRTFFILLFPCDFLYFDFFSTICLVQCWSVWGCIYNPHDTITWAVVSTCLSVIVCPFYFMSSTSTLPCSSSPWYRLDFQNI